MKTYKKCHNYEWGFGANFLPSTAINQLEMFQTETFDTETIDRELGWAANIGMKYMRIYLHDLLWAHDRDNLFSRLRTTLEIAEKYNIRCIIVFFDMCHQPVCHIGKQPEPKPYIHNSGWVQSPARDFLYTPERWGAMESYIKDVLSEFATDQRIIMWDLFNEPGNSFEGGADSKIDSSINKITRPFLSKVFEWARSIETSQPYTSAPWNYSPEFSEINNFQVNNSDVISFHCYDGIEALKERIEMYRKVANGRKIVCTEYMARPRSTFEELLYMKEQDVIAINWGLVSGKSQTIYPWGWDESKGTPDPFFHDIFNKDGSLLYPEEGAIFQQVSDKETINCL